MRHFSVLLLCLLLTPAWGYSYRISWNPVTEDTDGNPVTISAYRVERGLCGSTRGSVSVTVAGTESGTVIDIPADTFCWTVYAQAGSRESGPSNIIAFHTTADSDEDAVMDFRDNCIQHANADQVDSDADGYGNRCDGDLNGNKFTNSQDFTLFRAQMGRPSEPPVFNPADINTNGYVNSQDFVLFRQLMGSPPGPSGLQP